MYRVFSYNIIENCILCHISLMYRQFNISIVIYAITFLIVFTKKFFKKKIRKKLADTTKILNFDLGRHRKTIHLYHQYLYLEKYYKKINNSR